ncbi:MAG: preprotein translocase subunit SecG [Paraprevotella sp.]|nr:preprotein translocase subunit SecG [Paraprevotella sp.]
MYTPLVILIVIIAVLLCLIVLIQESKGGGLASSFSASNQIMGVRKTTDFIEKATWGLALAVAVLSIVAVKVLPEPTEGTSVIMKEAVEQKAVNAGNVQKFDATQTAPAEAAPAETAPAAAPETPAQ